MVQLLLLILGEMGSRHRAMTAHLYRGRTHRQVITAEGEVQRIHVPSAQAGGLAARLGRSPRTIGRYLRIAEQRGILRSWQVRDPHSLSQFVDLTGTVARSGHAYGTYQLIEEPSRELVERLTAWGRYGPDRQRSTQRESGPTVVPQAREGAPLSPEAQAIAAMLLAEVSERGPPP